MMGTYIRKPMSVNYEIKSQLLNFLVTEDLVVENKNVSTSFDVLNRVLTLPYVEEEHQLCL